MKAMLEPRIVAASTHGSAALGHDAACPARTTPSSHGVLAIIPSPLLEGVE
jgi:hypothetical protein